MRCGKGRGQTTEDTVVLIPAREAGLVLVNSGSAEKWSDSRSIFKEELTGLELRKEREKSRVTDSKFLGLAMER